VPKYLVDDSSNLKTVTQWIEQKLRVFFYIMLYCTIFDFMQYFLDNLVVWYFYCKTSIISVHEFFYFKFSNFIGWPILLFIISKTNVY